MSKNIIHADDRRTESRRERDRSAPEIRPLTHADSKSVQRAETATGVDTVTDGASDSPVGQVLGGTYLLGECLASGGMGEIYAARHLRLPGTFAVKMLQPSLCMEGLLRERFRQEAEIMATLRHPHVAQVIDYNVTPEGRPFLVMELIEGEDLAKVAAREGVLEPARAAMYVRQVASALAVAHARGIVHLDLKPENVMVSSAAGDEPFAKVIDFGIAQSPGRESGERTPLMGTPDYMAPEQVNGGGAGLDGRADQFSLAVMAYHLLTGESPWGRHDEPMAMLFRICHEAPRSFADCAVPTMPEVEAVLSRALAKRPEDRFETVTEFAQAFDAAAAADAPVANPVEVTTPIAQTSATNSTSPDIRPVSGLATRALKWRRRSGARMLGFALVAGLFALLANVPRLPWPPRLGLGHEGMEHAGAALGSAHVRAPVISAARPRQGIALLP